MPEIRESGHTHRYSHDPRDPHGNFAEGQELDPGGIEEREPGAFSEGQERIHEHDEFGRFSTGQEGGASTVEEERVGDFADGLERP